MKRAARTLGVALIGHLVFWAIALVTAVAAEVELRARGIDHLDPESLLEMFVREGLFAAPARVVVAGMMASFCVSPFLEGALAVAATRAGSLRDAFRDAARLTPASLGVMLLAALVTASALGFLMLAPWAVSLLTDQLFDDRTRASYLALAAIPSLAALLGFGVVVDVGRLHLARGASPTESVVRGLRATFSRLFLIYACMLTLGLAASVAHALLGRTNDASSLVAGGVILVFRPVLRALFMLVAARHELTR